MIGAEKAPVKQKLVMCQETLQISGPARTILEKISGFFRPGAWSPLFVDEETPESYFEIAIGESAGNLKTVRLKPGQGIAGWVVCRFCRRPALHPVSCFPVPWYIISRSASADRTKICS